MKEEIKECCYRVVLHWKENGQTRKMGVLVNALCAFSALCKVSPLLSNLVKNNIIRADLQNVGEPLS